MIKLIILSIGFYAILGLFAFSMHDEYFRDIDRQKAIDGGIIVEAEYIGISSIPGGSGATTYGLRYSYIDENGLKYSGNIHLGNVSIEEAESHIGEKVNIYIDGKGNSIPVGETTNANLCLVIAIIMDICLLAYTIFVICAFRKIYKDNKAYKEQELAKQNKT